MDKIDNTFIERRTAQILADTYDEDMEATDMFEQSVDLGRFAIEVVEGALEEYGVNFDYTENPELIIWENYGISKFERALRALIFVIFTLGILAICFFFVV